MCCDAHRAAAGRRDQPAAVRAAGAVERPAATACPRAGVVAAQRHAVRVVVVVADAQDVAELVGVRCPGRSSPPGWTSRRRRSARWWRPACQRGPRRRSGSSPSSAGRGPAGPTRRGRPPWSGTSSGRTPARWTTRPGRRRGRRRSRTVGDRVADRRRPRRRAPSVRMFLVARVPGRAGAGPPWKRLDAVLVGLAGHLVRAEAAEVDAVAAAGVLHPVLVEGVPAVQVARLVEEVRVELPAPGRGARSLRVGLRVAEDGRVRPAG